MIAGLGVLTLLQFEHLKRHFNRRWWMRPWATESHRAECSALRDSVARGSIHDLCQGFVNSFITELRITNPESFKNFIRPFVTGLPLGETINEASIQILEVLRKKKGPVDPVLYIGKMVTNIVYGVIFGETYELDDKEFGEFLNAEKLFTDSEGGIYWEDLFPFLLNFIPPRKLQLYVKNETVFHQIIAQKVEQHKKTFSPDRIRGFADAVLLARHKLEQKEQENQTEVSPFTDEHVLYTISDVFGGSLGTTRNTFMFALKYMAAYPDVQKKVQNEIDQVVGRDRLPLPSDRESLCYTEAVINEVLRLCPPAPLALPYRTVRDTSIGNYSIPKDTGIMFNIWALHHDPDHWENHNDFIPERFLHGGRVSKPRSWLPYSIGMRSCFGKTLAQIELVTLLAIFMHSFTVQFPDGSQPNMNYELGKFVMFPTPFKLLFIER